MIQFFTKPVTAPLAWSLPEAPKTRQTLPVPLPRFGIDQFLYTKEQRLAMVFDKLTAMGPVSNPLMAYQQLVIALKDVEDIHTIFPYDPTNRLKQSVRMYLPLPPEEQYYAFEQFPGVTYLPSKGHHIMIGRNGAIEIQKRDPRDRREVEDRPDAVVYRKAGANGHHVWDDPMNQLP